MPSIRAHPAADIVKFSPDGNIHVLIQDAVVAVRDLVGNFENNLIASGRKHNIQDEKAKKIHCCHLCDGKSYLKVG